MLPCKIFLQVYVTRWRDSYSPWALGVAVMTILPYMNQHQHLHHHQIPPGGDDRLRNAAVQPTEEMEKYAQIPLRLKVYFSHR